MTERNNDFNNNLNHPFKSNSPQREHHFVGADNPVDAEKAHRRRASISSIEFYRDLSLSRGMTDFMGRTLSVINRLGFSDYSLARFKTNSKIDGYTVLELSTSAETDTPGDKSATDGPLVSNTIYGGTKARPCTAKPVEKPPTAQLTDSTVGVAKPDRISQVLSKAINNFGGRDYLPIPMQAKSRSGKVLFVVQSTEGNGEDFQTKADHHRAVLHLLAEAIDFIGTSKFPQFFLGNENSREIVVTPRPVQLLNTLSSCDLTLKEAAAKLDIDIDTAKKYVASIKKALGVNTQAAAIYRAVQEGLLNIEKQPKNSTFTPK